MAPNHLPAATAAVQVTGSGPGGTVPLPSAAQASVDRPQDRQPSDAKLGACLTNSTVPPVVDRDAWRPAARWTSRSGDVVRTARDGSLLVTCVFQDDGIGTIVSDGTSLVDGTVPDHQKWEVGPNPVLYTSTVFVDFDWADGASRSGTLAVSGLTLDPRVTELELSRPESAPARARVVAGTFVLGGVDLSEGTHEQRARTDLTAYAADGTILALLSPPI